MFETFNRIKARMTMMSRAGSVVTAQATVCEIISCQNVGDSH